MTQRDYDLPATVSLKWAVVLAVFSGLSPSWPSAPIIQILGLCIILFFAIHPGYKNELGLSWRVSKDAIIVMAAIVSITIIGLIGLGMIVDTIKIIIPYDFDMYGDIRQVSYFRTDYFVEFKTHVHLMLAERQLLPVLALSIQPLLLTVVFAPLFESVFMFGILFPVLYREFGYKRAVIASAIAFTLFHPPIYSSLFALIAILFSAFINAVLYAETKSLYPTIVFHACWNFSIHVFITIANWGLPPPVVP